MKKELTVYVETMESGEDFSISSVTKRREFIVITTPTGIKFTANVEDLLLALTELKKFNEGNKSQDDKIVEHDITIEYGE